MKNVRCLGLACHEKLSAQLCCLQCLRCGNLQFRNLLFLQISTIPPPTSRTAYSYNTDAQLYGQNSGGPYFDSQAGGAHVTTVVSSASGAVPTHGMVGIAMDVGSSHIISSGSTYLIHGGNMEGSRNHISHSSRSSSVMVRDIDVSSFL